MTNEPQVSLKTYTYNMDSKVIQILDLKKKSDSKILKWHVIKMESVGDALCLCIWTACIRELNTIFHKKVGRKNIFVAWKSKQNE